MDLELPQTTVVWPEWALLFLAQETQLHPGVTSGFLPQFATSVTSARLTPLWVQILAMLGLVVRCQPMWLLPQLPPFTWCRVQPPAPTLEGNHPLLLIGSTFLAL